MKKYIVGIIIQLMILISCYPQNDGFISLLKEHRINDILIKNDSSWICCNNGLLIEADVSEKTYYYTYLLDDGGDFNINAIAIDSSGSKWLATDIGLFKQTSGVVTRISLSDIQDFDTITTVAIDYDNTVWIGTNNNYILSMNSYGLEWFKITEGNNRVFSIKVDSENNKWIGVTGDQSGIYAFNHSVFDTLELNSFGNKNSSITIDNLDRVWIASGGDYLSMYDGNNIIRFGKEDGIACNNISSIYNDINNNIWVFDSSYGFSYYNGTVWTSISNNILELFLRSKISINNWYLVNQTKYFEDKIIEGDSLIYFMNHSNVSDKLIDRDTIWMCSSDGYLIKVYPNTKTYELIKIIEGWDSHLLSMTSLAIDSNRIKWITSCIGVFKYDGKNIFKYDTNNGLAVNCVFAVAVDHNNRKWFGAEGTNIVSIYDDTDWDTIMLADGAWAYSIKIDKNNYKWIGGGKPGVIVLNSEDSVINTIALTDFAYLNNSMLIDQHNNKWFASNDFHVYEYINDTLCIFDQSDGLINNIVTSIREDRNGNIWIIDDNNFVGVSIFNGNKWTSFPYGLIEIFLREEIRHKKWIPDILPYYQTDDEIIQIYSDPIHDFLAIKVQSDLLNSRFNIYSIDGKLVKTGIINSETQTINMDNVVSGLFILHIYNKSASTCRKIIF